jgi:hypothetical protein
MPRPNQGHSNNASRWAHERKRLSPPFLHRLNFAIESEFRKPRQFFSSSNGQIS